MDVVFCTQSADNPSLACDKRSSEGESMCHPVDQTLQQAQVPIADARHDQDEDMIQASAEVSVMSTI
jgi:hypothetical protein